MALLISTQAGARDPEESSSADQSHQPTAEQMILDGLVYRPISLAGTLVGTGIFIVTLPFSLIGGNADVAGQRLVLEPASDTFLRCLGCLPAENSRSHSYQH